MSRVARRPGVRAGPSRGTDRRDAPGRAGRRATRRVGHPVRPVSHAWPSESPAASPHDDALAEDVVQEAFLGAWRGADRYVAGRGSVRTWLLSIVHHRAIDAVRRRRPASELPAEQEGERTPEPLVLPDVWGEVSGRLDRDAIAAAARDAVRTSSARPSSSPTSSGLTQVEIAERTGVPLGTVKGRVRLALAGDAPGARPRRGRRRRHDGAAGDGLRRGPRARAAVRARRAGAGRGGRGPRAPRDLRRRPRRARSSTRRSRARCCSRREPVEPPAALKGRLLAAAEADLREGRHPSTRPRDRDAPASDVCHRGPRPGPGICGPADQPRARARAAPVPARVARGRGGA